MDRARTPTIIDIATEAGVSKSAVSRALLGQGDVSPDTRRKVEAAAARLGYVANAMARGLVSSRTGTLGVVLRDVRKPYYSYLESSMQSRAAERGYRLVTTTNSGEQEVEDGIRELTNLISLRVDGILIAPARLPTERFLPYLERVPIVVAGRREAAAGLDSVAGDDWRGGQDLAAHVAATGHSRIGVVLVDRDYSTRYHERGHAMIKAIRAAGREAVVAEVPTDLGAAHAAMRHIDQVTAFMCPTDDSAMDLLELLRVERLQHSVSGYGGYGPLAAPFIGLTTYRSPQEEIGRTAVDLLVDRITGGASHDRHVSLQGRVIPGRTVKDSPT